MSKGRNVPPIKRFLGGGAAIKEKAQGHLRFMEGLELLQRYLTSSDDDSAETILDELRDYRQRIHALAAEKKLNS